jgi:hypothetical protein
MSSRGRVLLLALHFQLALGPAAGGDAIRAHALVAFVVAPSASTRLEAQHMLRVCGWADTSLVRDADLLLVVVRSSNSEPLSPSYDSLKWLQDAAASQLNDSGAQFHVYLFTIRQDLSFLQSSHRSYDVNATGTLTSEPDPPRSTAPRGTLYPCS